MKGTLLPIVKMQPLGPYTHDSNLTNETKQEIGF